MKMKTLLSLAIVMSMMLSAMPLIPYASARNIIYAPDPIVLSVIFDNGLGEVTKAISNNFIVNITLSIPAGIQMDFWDMEIHWDPTKVELQTHSAADAVEGPFMAKYPNGTTRGATVFVAQAPDNGAGILPDIACGFVSGGPVDGPVSGVLMQVKFHCIDQGDSIIEIYKPNEESYILLGINGINIDTTNNGLLHQVAPPATPPTAVITAPNKVPVCTMVTLDGTGSLPGHDSLPLPSGNDCPITNWNWQLDFVYTNGTPPKTVFLTGDIVQFHCDGPGTVTVTLTVTAPDPVPPTAGGYVDHDDAQKVIEQFIPAPPPTGAFIDVYVTNNGDINGTYGSAPPYDVWADAYGPQQLVCVEAKVTYNNEPVEYKPVAFEVIDAHGVSVDYRVVFTDENGLAGYCFRLPWEGKDAEAEFGAWSIVGTVDIAEHIVTDTVRFRFGYLLYIQSITLTPSYPTPVFKYPKMNYVLHIVLNVTNIAFTTKLALLTVVAYDNCTVPVGKATTPGLDPVPADTSTLFAFDIIIPHWAFVGSGAAYANIFTKAPSAGGVPYCPEATELFYIGNT